MTIDHTDEWRFSCHHCGDGHRSHWHGDKTEALAAMDRHVKRLHANVPVVSVDLEVASLESVELVTVYRFEND